MAEEKPISPQEVISDAAAARWRWCRNQYRCIPRPGWSGPPGRRPVFCHRDFAVGAVKSAVMKRSQQNYLLIDETKFNTRGLCTWTYTRKFDRI